MYEVLKVKRMMQVKSNVVRNRKKIPVVQGGRGMTKAKWRAVILVEGGLTLERLNHIPSGSEIKLCIQDKTLWEIFIPEDYKKSVKLLAKRLDAVAFL
jgi:hypothetical protein